MKKGKPTSRAIPPSIQKHVPESALYGQLQKDERALDWTLARKRAELTDGLATRPVRVSKGAQLGLLEAVLTRFSPAQIKRTLRIFLSNTCANQPFQKEEQAAIRAQQRGQDLERSATPQTKPEGASGGDASNEAGPSNSSSDADVPSWTLRIEGRLLDPSFRSRAVHAKMAQATSDRIGGQKFSNLIKTCVVELARDPASYPAEENLVEWHRPVPNVAPQAGTRDGHEAPLITASDPGLDGFEIKRKGSEPVKCKIALYLAHTPERYALDPNLAMLLDIKEETRAGVISALWAYIKDRKLLDERDRRLVRLDGPLQSLFKTEVISFHHLPEVVNRLLHPPNPIVIEYWVRTDVDANKHTTAYDIDLDLEDWMSRVKQERVLSTFDAQGEQAREVADLDERIAQAVQALANHGSARDFLYEFSQDPQRHLEAWLASQARDLDSILGTKASVPGAGWGSGVSNEEMRRAETFAGAWIDEAITGHVALETARKKRELEAKANEASAARREREAREGREARDARAQGQQHQQGGGSGGGGGLPSTFAGPQ